MTCHLTLFYIALKTLHGCARGPIHVIVEKSTLALGLWELSMLANSEMKVTSMYTYYILFSVQNIQRVCS